MAGTLLRGPDSTGGGHWPMVPAGCRWAGPHPHFCGGGQLACTRDGPGQAKHSSSEDGIGIVSPFHYNAVPVYLLYITLHRSDPKLRALVSYVVDISGYSPPTVSTARTPGPAAQWSAQQVSKL